MGGSDVFYSVVVRGLLAMAIVAAAVVTQAEVIIDTVRVGNAGNASDTRYATPGYGAVGHTYNIGKYEVTAGQYTAFLNAVAATDTYGLYNEYMYSSSYYDFSGCKIRQSGSSGSYTYMVDANGDGVEDADWLNRPVNYVSFWDAARFANWLHNGQPTGAQTSATTERGAYTLDGYNGRDGRTIARNPGAKWFLPSEDEWYKAAYHKNDGVTGNYFDYPTSSDNEPSNVLGNPTDPGNNATYMTYWDNDYTIGAPYYRTEVGAHENSDSPYGTFDQGGNVHEWNETVVYEWNNASSRGLRGGSFCEYSYVLLASTRPGGDDGGPMGEIGSLGFRVASVPEPAGITMLFGIAVTALLYYWRKRV
jgi:formylglycine-generating enzyme